MSCDKLKSVPLAALVLLVCAATACGVNIDLVTVGNPGNAPDITGYGAVPYTYQIGKYEVTNSQYAEFLNAVDCRGANPHNVYNFDMGIDYGGISFNSDSLDGSKYSVLSGRGNMPVNNVTFWDACRFANWLNSGQGNADTETGAYTLSTDGIANNTVTRNGDARWVLTSENEWYKAAYYDPNKLDGAGYWKFPIGSDTIPLAESPPGMESRFGSANYGSAAGGLTDVGAYTFKPSTSPYGTFDQGGNVWEWNEAILGAGTNRGLRGGAFDESYASLDLSCRNMNDPETLGLPIDPGDVDPNITLTGYHIGFRVAYVPEPGSVMLLLAGGSGWLICWRRWKA